MKLHCPFHFPGKKTTLTKKTYDFNSAPVRIVFLEKANNCVGLLLQGIDIGDKIGEKNHLSLKADMGEGLKIITIFTPPLPLILTGSGDSESCSAKHSTEVVLIWSHVYSTPHMTLPPQNQQELLV